MLLKIKSTKGFKTLLTFSKSVKQTLQKIFLFISSLKLKAQQNFRHANHFISQSIGSPAVTHLWSGVTSHSYSQGLIWRQLRRSVRSLLIILWKVKMDSFLFKFYILTPCVILTLWTEYNVFINMKWFDVICLY